MLSRIAIKNPPPIVRYDEETTENPKRQSRHSKEVLRRNHFSAVVQECRPSLSRLRVSRCLPHSAKHGPLRDIGASIFNQQAEDSERYEQRFLELKREFQHLECFCKRTVLRRMVKCGKAYCACLDDPDKRHGSYFDWTYKAKGKTVNEKLSPETMPVYRVASKQYQKLKLLLNRMERISQTVLRHQAKMGQSKSRGRS
jgi:hypothetical protein